MDKKIKLNIGLLLLFLFHAISNVVFILMDTTPFMGFASTLYMQSFFYWQTFLNFIKSGNFSLLQPIFNIIGLQGQLTSIITIPFYSLFGVSQDVAIVANQVFFFVLILSIFGIGRTLFDDLTGFLAAFFVSFYPSVFGFSRIYMLTFPILSISTLCILFLIKSDGFRNRKHSVLFGLASGLGGLLRPRFFNYIFIPLLYYLAKNIITLYQQRYCARKTSLKHIAINISLSIILTYIFLFPWYSLSHLSDYFYYQKLWLTLPELSKIGPTLVNYIKVLFDAQLHWFFTFLFLLGLVISFFDRVKRSKIYFLLIWFVLTLLLLSSFGIKDTNEIVIPLASSIAIMSSAGLAVLERKKIGRYILLFLIFISMVQYLYISYSKMSNKIYSSVTALNKSYNKGHYFKAISISQGLLQLNNDDWKIDEITSIFNTRRNFDKEFSWKQIGHLEYMISLYFRRMEDDFVKVLLVENRGGSPVGCGLQEKVLVNNLPLVYLGLYPDSFDYKRLWSEKEIKCMVLGADYIVRLELEPRTEIISEIAEIFNRNISKFEKLRTVGTPYGKLFIYGRIIEDRQVK